MLQTHENASLKNFNTFGIEAYARYFVEINHKEELQELFTDAKWHKIQCLVLGGGSNMLFTQNFDGLVIKINIRGIEHRINHDEVIVEAGAGEIWNNFVNYCVSWGFAGVENLSLIPGSVGASPIQNIGAYGVELKDVFESCEAFEISTGNFVSFNNTDCKFGYRESVFKQDKKGQYIVCNVKFKLSTKEHINISYGAITAELEKNGITQPSIKDVSKVVSEIRVSKLPDPSTIGNAGSFFKNPVIEQQVFDKIHKQFPNIVHFVVDKGIKLAAGWLIEQCDWKGKVVGETGTWKNQALVLVNHGKATGQEVYNLSENIIESVEQKFGVRLEREVNIF
ncbi:UDP-N-acetylmuramate dehydrogenase [Pedobacter arcticus]|uniref:UDP-N-acetylmuramate dehydrogenase n=1 Tax=Pedobacter arcticus TaxID=752140 RepID=UPI0002E21089|nr:UDP-N-acetylmuramate dehydrogenase [Pedobacter arcticus]